MSNIHEIGKFKVRIFEDRRHTHLQCTHNGSQWQSINLSDKKQLRMLWMELGRYLEEDEWQLQQRGDKHGNTNNGSSSTV